MEGLIVLNGQELKTLRNRRDITVRESARVTTARKEALAGCTAEQAYVQRGTEDSSCAARGSALPFRS